MDAALCHELRYPWGRHISEVFLFIPVDFMLRARRNSRKSEHDEGGKSESKKGRVTRYGIYEGSPIYERPPIFYFMLRARRERDEVPSAKHGHRQRGRHARVAEGRRRREGRCCSWREWRRS